MIKLKLRTEFRSIKALADTEIPPFTVLTGVNGSGKSHLLEAVATGMIEVHKDGHELPLSKVLLIRSHNVTTNDSTQYEPGRSAREQYNLWNRFRETRDAANERLRKLKAEFSEYGLQSISDQDLYTMGLKKLERFLPSNVIPVVMQEIENAINEADTIIRTQVSHWLPVSARQAQLYYEKKLPLYTEEDFYQLLPWQPGTNRPFQQHLSILFAEYANAWRRNALIRLQPESSATLVPLTQEEFEIQNGPPPWTSVNSILELAKIPFRINSPILYEDKYFQAKLRSTITDTEIDFNSLSSGEQVLISFALCLFHSKEQYEPFAAPDVLLLDEVDSTLHPSMVQSILNVIQEVFIDKLKIHVILVTHSATTVAIAPDDAIYMMKPTGSNRISKCTKDQALWRLLDGIPAISIRHDNRRIVFTESKNDANAYEKLFGRLRTSLNSEVSLQFMPSSADGIGNCNEVRKIVKQLQSTKSVLGVIDWDKSQKSCKYVKVHGENERYSIENALQDPLLVAQLLLHENRVKPEILSLPEGTTCRTFPALPQSDWQIYVDQICGKMRPASETETETETDASTPTALLQVRKCEYQNGHTLSLPTWFLDAEKTALLNYWQHALPMLKAYSSPGKLSEAILNSVVEIYPEILPRTFMNLFRQLQDEKL